MVEVKYSNNLKKLNVMIFRIFIVALIFACGLYYLACFLELFGIIKFTSEKQEITFPKMLIPFYYFFKI